MPLQPHVYVYAVFFDCDSFVILGVNIWGYGKVQSSPRAELRKLRYANSLLSHALSQPSTQAPPYWSAANHRVPCM